ncbi:MAG: ATP-binding protein [Candidatus Thiodiazotropha endolucinida]
MTLTHRLILLVIAIVMSMLASGAYYAIDATRDNISDEIKSSARLTMQLLTAALISGTAENQPAEQQILISHLQRLNDIRHLNIAVVRGDGTIIYPFSERQQARQLSVPGWYIDLVKPPPAEYRKRIASPLIGTSEIVILADPTDEIQDAWREARSIVLLIVSFTFLCIILMAIIIRRSLQPVNEISTGLGIIQSGDYAARLPHFNLPELNRLLSVQESELRHLSRELHDELGQSISAIKAMAVTLKLQTDGEPESADAIIGVCNHMYGVVRDMMNRLRPVALEELGMVTAIERLVDGWNERQEECFCALTVNSNFDGTNVAKHAAAEKAEIRLERDANGLIALSIRDDGDGFDQSSRHKGMGLLGMRERVEALNGKISLASEPDQGVSIDIHLPFTQKTD